MTTYIHTYIEQLKYMNLSITKILERSYSVLQTKEITLLQTRQNPDREFLFSKVLHMQCIFYFIYRELSLTNQYLNLEKCTLLGILFGNLL